MSPPTLYEWIGGEEVLSKLTTAFYQKVKLDDILAPVFAKMSDDHPAHVAAFIGEVFKGPKTYSVKHGGHPEMIRHHLDPPSDRAAAQALDQSTSGHLRRD